MKITVQGKRLTLSPDQEEAVEACLAVLRVKKEPGGKGIEACLAGAAGTGKTTVLSMLIKLWKGGILFVAPTGKAAKRITQQTGRMASTIHSALYPLPEEDEDDRGRAILKFGDPQPPKGCGPGTLVICDEASMVGTKLAKDLREQVFAVQGKILWVGDHEQLQPIKDSWGAPLTRPTARLTKVHRQALESPVLELATLIRERRGGSFSGWGDEVQRFPGSTIAQAVEWVEESRRTDVLLAFGSDEPPTRVLLTWTNKVRAEANRQTRESRGYPVGRLVKGETLICRANNYGAGLMNGELLEVESVERNREMSGCIGKEVITIKVKGFPRRSFWVIPELFDKVVEGKSARKLLREAWKPLWAKRFPDSGGESSNELCRRMGWHWTDLRRFRDSSSGKQIQATWGYCLTVHSAQGSQWEEVAWLSCRSFRSYRDKAFKRRMIYTALTRAEERFLAFILS